MSNPTALVAHKYLILDPIGGGKFGQVFKGQNVRTGMPVAIKLEPSTQEFNLLKHESTVLNFLYSKWCRNIPPVYWFGNYDATQYAMVLPLYPESFAEFMAKESNSIQTAETFLRSAVLILHQIHRHGVVHRDIKPANWLFRFSKTGKEMILIDFGLATFVDHDIQEEPDLKKEHLIGTPKFASWFVHDGQEYQKRDDLLSVLYMALWIYYGDQFWDLEDADRNNIQEDTALPKTHVLCPMNVWLKRAKTRDRVVRFCAHLDNEKMVRMAETLYENNIEYSYCMFS